MANDIENVPLPAKSPTDHAHLIARAGIALMPVVGGAALELFNAVIAPPIERRRDKWIQAVAETLNQLQEKYDVLPETLASNDLFISIVMNASQIAIRTHEEVKLEALQNAIKNAALDLSTSGAREHMFLRLVDDLTAPQINLLLREKVSVSEPWGRGAEAKILGLVGNDKDTQFLAVEMLNDLARRALGDVEREGKELMRVSYSRMELGAAFAQFISEPVGKAKKP